MFWYWTYHPGLRPPLLCQEGSLSPLPFILNFTDRADGRSRGRDLLPGIGLDHDATIFG